jgi:hypothetical protein
VDVPKSTPDLARVVVAQLDPGADPRPDDEQRRRPARGELLVGTCEERHRRGEGDPVHLRAAEQAAQEHDELVPGALRLGRDAALLDELLALEEAEDRLGVADVDCQEHGRILRPRRVPDAMLRG